MKFLIYGFENMLNHKIYVGQTCRTLKERIQQHKNAKSLIGRAIRKYGLESFFIVILAECESKEEANELEIYLIKTLNCKAPNGYNCTDGGDGGLGVVVSEETRKKLSEAQKKRYKNPKERKKISLANKKRYENPEALKKFYENPEEHKKLSDAQKKRYANPLSHEKKSIEQKKRFENPEERKRVSLGNKKRYADPAEHEKTSLANKKHFENPEERKKISDALKARNKKIREQKNLENQNKS